MTESLMTTEEFTLKTSRRARYLRLRINPEGTLLVTAPHGATHEDVQRFIIDHSVWIRKCRKKLAEEEALYPKPVLAHGGMAYFLGERLTLRIEKISKSYPHVRPGEKELLIFLPASLSENPENIKSVLRDFYKKKAIEVIHDRLDHFNTHYQFRYNRVTFRNQKSRWGSCSRQKNLNFNWRLIMAPIEAIDYVVVHELSHLKELNHSARFWELVAQTLPDHKQWRKWIRKNQFLLRFS